MAALEDVSVWKLEIMADKLGAAVRRVPRVRARLRRRGPGAEGRHVGFVGAQRRSSRLRHPQVDHRLAAGDSGPPSEQPSDDGA